MGAAGQAWSAFTVKAGWDRLCARFPAPLGGNGLSPLRRRREASLCPGLAGAQGPFPVGQDAWRSGPW
ncbi:hypothetical protein GCM10010335_22370 [Streptomyces galbus]|nr:hypothetical protein GCM10010335_22370 [Streptomyces galbus]